VKAILLLSGQCLALLADDQLQIMFKPPQAISDWRSRMSLLEFQKADIDDRQRYRLVVRAYHTCYVNQGCRQQSLG
jgi:hypothetical protein